jgi:hypothetical protein
MTPHSRTVKTLRHLQQQEVRVLILQRHTSYSHNKYYFLFSNAFIGPSLEFTQFLSALNIRAASGILVLLSLAKRQYLLAESIKY